MNTDLNPSVATTALVSSLGSHASPAPVAPRDHADAALALRQAQLALYCDHDAEAMIALREARRALIGDVAAESVALARMDEAAWHIRRHDAPEAQRALAQARGRLG